MGPSFDPRDHLRSPKERLGEYVILPRLIDKVRLQAKGLLPESYHPNLLSKSEFTFDGRFLLFTGLDPEELRRAILASSNDQEVRQWVEQKGRLSSKDEIREWSDANMGSLSVPTEERIAMRSRFYQGLTKILDLPLLASVNAFDLIDFDEGRISVEELRRNHESRILRESKFPLPPFTRESAIEKVRLAEDAWNSRNPEKVALAYTVDSRWRNRSEFFNGRFEIAQFLTRKWKKELDYRLIKELWTFEETKISVRFAYEWHDDSENWFRSYGNENWEFAKSGLMSKRLASINDLPIKEEDRKFHWPQGPRPHGHPSLSDLGL